MLRCLADLVGSLRLADVTQRAGLLPSLLALLLGCTGVWFAVEVLFGAAPLVDGLGGRGWILGGVLLAGCLVDVMFAPSGTVFGVAALAVCIAVFARSRELAVVMVVLAVCFVLLNVASLADIGGVDEVMSGDGGGAARAAALGLVLMVTGIASGVAEVHDG